MTEEAAEFEFQFDVGAAVAKQQALLTELAGQKAEALAVKDRDRDYHALKALDDKLKRESSRLGGLLQVPELRAKLQASQSAEDWAACISLQSQISAIENSFGNVVYGSAVKLLEDVKSWPAGTQGVVVAVDLNDEDLPFQVLFPEDTYWVEAGQVAPCEFRHGHSAGYRMFARSPGSKSLILFAGPVPTTITRICGSGGEEGQCSHTVPQLGMSHWMCCGQTGLFSACSQAFTHGLGDGVIVDGTPGVVTCIDLTDPKLPYFVSCVDNTSRWVRESKLGKLDVEAPVPAVHRGEFRASGKGPSSRVLYGNGNSNEAGRELNRFCSLPDRGQVDGPACTHAFEGTVHVVMTPHWSCCGQDLFAPECQVQKPTCPGDLARKMGELLAMKALLGALE
jgi:hypothetical protein